MSSTPEQQSREKIDAFPVAAGRIVLNRDEFKRSPFAEQTRSVAEVERRLSVVDELETLVQTTLQRATCLLQSVLQQAFSGHLAS